MYMIYVVINNNKKMQLAAGVHFHICINFLFFLNQLINQSHISYNFEFQVCLVSEVV